MENIILKENKKNIYSVSRSDDSIELEDNLSIKDVKELRELRLMIKEIISRLDSNVLDGLVNELKKASMPEEFAGILKSIKYREIYDRDFKKVSMMYKMLSGRLSLPASLVVVKEVLYHYFSRRLLFFKDEIKGLEMMNIEELYDSILKYIKEEFEQSAKANGVYDLSLKAISQATEDTFKNSQDHLCFDCKNAWPTKCEKVAHLKKKHIDEYDFIDRGYQVIDENGEVSEFIVTKCANFKGTSKVKKYKL